uniref:histidine kinase n=1 Tax=mine drainage metagenome TaxID=410659 RepID=E6QQD6_9ZZZZ
MRRFFDSIANRVFLILLAGMLFAVGITSWLADNTHRNVLLELHNFRVADRVEQIVLSLDQATPEMRKAAMQTSADFGLQAQLVHDAGHAQAENSALAMLLKSRLGTNHHVIVSTQTGCHLDINKRLRAQPGIARELPRINQCQVVYVSLKDGALLELKFPMIRELWEREHPLYMPYFTLFLMLIALLAYVVASMVARPIKRLSEAAAELGHDIDQPPLQDTGGPLEIRQAAHAFNAMQARIKRQIQHRTHMLAAITHDLQTPLTRLRLRMEKVNDEDLRYKLISDLAGMQNMVREGLDLARSMDSAEMMQRLDIDSLLDSLCADAVEMGQDVTLEGHAQVSILAQPHALRRCLTNLLDNAVKYGHYARVQISLENGSGQGYVEIRIRDGGQGISEEQLIKVFEPFVRLEVSRSRDTGGTGLGLTIARNIAENHRASLILRNHPEGGLEVILRLLPE